MTSHPLRIIFMGTPDFAVPTLQALLDHGETVVTVVTQPDRPKGRGMKLTPSPIKELAVQAGIPVLQPTKIRTLEFEQTLRLLAPDLIVVAAYGRLLPATLMAVAPLGAINVHGSLLPKFRGAAPVQWAIMTGEAETGITIMQMDAGMDTGDILLTAAIPIASDDTAGSLGRKLSALGGRTLIEALTLLRAGELRPQKQPGELATLAPPLAKEDGRIDWTKGPTEISCRIRAMDPWPTASTYLGDVRLRLFAPRVEPGLVRGRPGEILATWGSDGLLVATGQADRPEGGSAAGARDGAGATGAIRIGEVQREGGKRLPADVFSRGMANLIGAVLK